MNRHSEQRLKQVHPALAERVRRLIGRLAAKGVTVEVTQGLRTFAEQDHLFAQGRTRPGKIVTRARGGQSNHNYGLAVDLCPFVAGKPDWDAAPYVWQMIGMEAERLGLEWGGNWKFVDRPHVQLSAMSVAQCRALYKQGGLPLVWERASAAVRAIEAPLAPKAGVTAKAPAPSAVSAALPSLDPAPFPAAWPVTVPELRRPAAVPPTAPGRDSRKSQQTVLSATLAQIWSSVLAWWQGVDVRLIYAGLMIGLTVLALAYLYRQTVMGKIREARSEI